MKDEVVDGRGGVNSESGTGEGEAGFWVLLWPTV